MSRRPGLSLTEVLVALFIMGIGCIAILTLFPLGALNMAQAFRDDRCTQSAYQADAYLRAYVQTARDTGRLNAASEKFVEALTDPDPGATRSAKNYMPPVGGGMPSYPVFIDPLGYRARGGTNDAPPAEDRIQWLGDHGFGVPDITVSPPVHKSALARRSLRFITSLNANAAETAKQQPLAIRTCSLLDGFGYDLNGQPTTVGGGTTIDRDLRYNWLWVIQKPDAGAAPTNVTVVTFDKRAPGYAPTGTPLETVWTPEVAAVGQTLVTFKGRYDNNTVPTVQRGGWLLDCSIALIDRSSPVGPKAVDFAGSANRDLTKHQPWIRNAHFYRVVSVAENTTVGGIDVELEVPLRPDTGRNPSATPAEPQLDVRQRRFMYLSGAAEVFERPLPLDI
ncbi:MAG TPA: prepilin-type N-terminal cleavage/methylation domain-containing protein [Urbifossiella sp.]|nr:prepilin-type N-terminal cleavage/methylation domain-containing protein [Urbifossiella sp.]